MGLYRGVFQGFFMGILGVKTIAHVVYIRRFTRKVYTGVYRKSNWDYIFVAFTFLLFLEGSKNCNNKNRKGSLLKLRISFVSGFQMPSEDEP